MGPRLRLPHRRRALSTILRYEILRLRVASRPGLIDVPADYLEIVTVSSYDDYESELQGMPGRDKFLAEMRSYVECVLTVRSDTV